MTEIQQVQWELEMDYIGHPYYVSGNAILHALGQSLSRDTHQSLHASHGMFVPGQFGRFPEEHSQSGIRPYLGAGLPDVEAYADLFVQRDPHHEWLLDSRARDALNTHDIRTQSGHPALAYETIMGRPAEGYRNHKTTKWYLNAYLHAGAEDILPIGEEYLDGLQFGGKRNYGYGVTRLKETQIVDLEALSYSSINDCNCVLKLVTPFVLRSTYPEAACKSIPWWWSDASNLRTRKEKILEQREVYRLDTVDHGQLVGYDGDDPIATARKGVTRVGTHSKYGFGEIQVMPSEGTKRPVNGA